MNRTLSEKLFKEKIAYITSTEFFSIHNYLMIGSVIQNSNKNSIIWGSGFHFKTSSFVYSKPKKVLAVRGPLTREKLMEFNVDCPEVYGDPALLMPGIFDNQFVKKYKIGIVPHYLNANDKWLQDLSHRNDVIIIDVKESPFEVIKKITSCEVILSSSLHGIIISDAYKIPNIWIDFDLKIGRDHFKFHDYFLSVNRATHNPINIKDQSLDQVLESAIFEKIQFDPKPLLDSCPFKIDEFSRNKILSWYKMF